MSPPLHLTNWNGIVTRGCLGSLLFFLLCSKAFCHDVTLLLGQENWRYQEYSSDNTVLNTEKGWLDSITIASIYTLTKNHSLVLNYQYLQGQIKYTGKTQTGISHNTKTKERVQGSVVAWRYRSDAAYYGAGILFNTWQRSILPKEPVIGIYEKYSWYGPQIEIGTYKDFANIKLDAGLMLQLLRGNIRAHIEGINIPKIPLKSGYNAIINLTAEHKITTNFSLVMQLSAGYRKFSKSNQVTAHSKGRTLLIHEPKSHNAYFGLHIGGKISF